MAHPYAGIAANTYIKTVDDHVFDSYEACVAFTQQHEPESRTDITMRDWHIASNVRLRYNDAIGCFDIVLYNSPVVRYYNDGTFSADNNGFNTPTTSRRISQFTPDGYGFYHHNKKLVMNFGDEECTHSRRFPVRKEQHNGN